MYQDQVSLERAMEEATPKFVEAALTSRLKTVFPNVSETDLPAIVTLVHEDMKVERATSDLMQELAPYRLGEPAQVREEVSKMQWAIGGALMGLGTDILEPDAVDQILWDLRS